MNDRLKEEISVMVTLFDPARSMVLVWLQDGGRKSARFSFPRKNGQNVLYGDTEFPRREMRGDSNYSLMEAAVKQSLNKTTVLPNECHIMGLIPAGETEPAVVMGCFDVDHSMVPMRAHKDIAWFGDLYGFIPNTDHDDLFFQHLHERMK